ncbi:hypothetical protein HOLleu_42927 [Holothuria leucospilota]|uniref:Transposase domain-containing protein n=1 Tax=Holothuria leucospilota TaxID=206669 RepID=A0A9Q1BBX1_HOLLE|nr:hypothetical protein HOLleu_42927 [Holothuria leucospilota]
MQKEVSYWTKRRRIRSAVEEHIQAVQTSVEPSSANHSIHNSTPLHQLSVEGKVGHPSAEKECNLLGISEAIALDVSSLDGHTDEFDEIEFQYVDHSVSEGSEEDVDDLDLNQKLADWAVDYGIPHVALNSLLTTLQQYHSSLPKDSRTLLTTTRTVTTQSLAGGSFYHIGLKKGIMSKLHNNSNTKNVYDLKEVSVKINIDGLPLFKSSNMQLWPILGIVDQLTDKEPFIISVYCGLHKPISANEFLEPFISEVNVLEKEGLLSGDKVYPFSISAVICDAPARCFIKYVKDHSGYAGCDKCMQHGKWIGKMTFPEVSAPLRTDESFREMIDEEHHLGVSAFMRTSLGMVSQFPLDYMHLVCLGVVRRLIMLWRKGPLKTRIGTQKVTSISEPLTNCRPFIPLEFARKTRGIDEAERWKATEFRTFLLYTGPVVLNGQLPEPMYKNFMLLSVGIRILLSPALCESHVGYAQELLVSFVKHWGDLYGQDQLVYNVHCLTHLAAETKTYGPLDNVSAFPFENFLGRVKKMVRKPDRPLQQIIRRLSEEQEILHDKAEGNNLVWKSHKEGPVPVQYFNSEQFSYAKIKDFTIGISQENNTVRINNEICKVCNILYDNFTVHIVYQVYRQKHSYFVYPLESKHVDIYQVSDLCNALKVSPLTSVSQKFLLMRTRGINIAMALLHIN